MSDRAGPFSASLPHSLLRVFAPSRDNEEQQGGRDDGAHKSNSRSIHYFSPLNRTRPISLESPVLLFLSAEWRWTFSFFKENSSWAEGRA